MDHNPSNHKHFRNFNIKNFDFKILLNSNMNIDIDCKMQIKIDNLNFYVFKLEFLDS